MRYLYGDSAPFPLQYDFLATLDAFVTSAARATQLAFELREGLATAARSAATRARAVESLDAFHRTIARLVHDSAAKSSEPLVAEYSAQLATSAAMLLDDARRSATQTTEREQSNARGDGEKRRGEIRAAIETFLLNGRLPVDSAKLSMDLHDGHNELSAVFTHPAAIETAFALATRDLPAWAAPRRVSEFATGLELAVGIRKSLFKRTTSPEMIKLDELYIGGFELDQDEAEIRLRKKPDAPRDALIFTLRRVAENLVAEVRREEDGADALPQPVDPGDRDELERLWQLLRAGVTDVLEHKERVLAAEVDGQDLFEPERVVVFVERVVKLFAPIVVEIARRSPNPLELSLKHERDGGRREEMYLKKADLAARLAPLSRAARGVFAPLGIADAEDVTGEIEILLDD